MPQHPDDCARVLPTGDDREVPGSLAHRVNTAFRAVRLYGDLDEEVRRFALEGLPVLGALFGALDAALASDREHMAYLRRRCGLDATAERL